jgi:hypothetical protein
MMGNGIYGTNGTYGGLNVEREHASAVAQAMADKNACIPSIERLIAIPFLAFALLQTYFSAE